MKSFLTKELVVRRIEPEILDGLPVDDPDAIASRRDLVHINTLMMQVRSMVTLLQKHVSKPPRRILEIGAGDGSFMLAVARRMAKAWPEVDLLLLDRADLIDAKQREEFRKLGWRAEIVTAEVLDWTARANDAGFDLVSANLFLHHFDDAELVRLFSNLKRLAPVFVATEPCRAAFPLVATRLLRVIGASNVTMHDAAASVRAAFHGTELSELWRAAGGAVLEERRGGLFTHVFAGDRGAASTPA